MFHQCGNAKKSVLTKIVLRLSAEGIAGIFVKQTTRF